MFFGFWSWVLVAIVVAAIFYANKLPQLKQQAGEKLKEGKVLLEKSKKELEAKATVLAEKAKEKQKASQSKTSEKKAEETKTEITEEDLAFMPAQTEEKKEEAPEDNTETPKEEKGE